MRAGRDQHLGETDIAGDNVAASDAAGGEKPAICVEMKENECAIAEIAAHMAGRPIGKSGDLPSRRRATP